MKRLTVVYRLTELATGRCKTGIAYEDRFDARLDEHKDGKVLAVKGWHGRVRVEVVKRTYDRQAASRFAHRIERQGNCEPTPGP
jgi:hypothetical protein